MQSATTSFSPGTSVAHPTSTIEIAISCRNVLDKDILSKSDPMCVIFHQPLGSSHWVELLRTETIQNNLCPDFFKKLTIEYRFEEQQHLKFEVYDIDSPSANLADHDFLGYAETTVAAIVSSGPHGLSLPLMITLAGGSGIKKSHGTIILIAEELSSLKDEITLKCGAQNVGEMSCCVFPPTVFYTISKVNEASKYVLVHRSDGATGPDPTWKSLSVSMRSLCNGDRDRGLKIECYQEKYSGSHKLLGVYVTNLNQLISLGTGGGVKLQRPDSRGETNSTFLILECRVSQIFTFVDYIQNGTKIHCCFAIDFTSSNGDPSDPTSLHHFSGGAGRPNPYEQAMQCVGDIVQDYDDTKMFPVMGFGSRIPPNGIVSHNFNITLNESPYCYGISGVLEAYRNCIRQIQMYGPTNFAPVINSIARVASNSRGGEDYYILLIITDGIITDMPNTKEAIVNASTLPLSIIIVGVGGADFDAMEELDGDAVRLSSNGRYAERDIVQFVPYRDAMTWMNSTVGPGTTSYIPQYSGQSMGMPVPYDQPTWNQQSTITHKLAQIKLAQEVLQEIPDQLTSYMKSKGIRPKMKHT